jgi:putative ABC transport system permease protein
MQDLRYAFRMLKKQPGFTTIAVLTLALGIGANTAIFSVVNAVLLRPLPYPHSEELVLLRERLLGPSGFEAGSVSYMNYQDWRAAQRSFTDLALVRREGANLSGADSTAPPERITAARITANYLSVLGATPQIGRDFVEKDDVPGAAKVVLISERLWRNRFAALPLALGQRLNVDGVPREIIGVVPERVRFPRTSDIFLPLADLRAEHDFLSRGNHESFSCLGRLKPGVTLSQAIAELDTIAADLARRFPDSNHGRQISAKQLLEFSVGEYRQLLYLLLGAVTCVLLIACANVANLQLARGIARRKEMAVRAALGASRWQLARQVLIETGVITLLGGCCAALIALWSLDTIRVLSPATRTLRFQETTIDPTVLLFTTGIVVFATFIVGIWPALRISRNASMANELHDNGARGSDGGQRQHARSILVIAQVALAVVLLAAAGLTLKSFWRAQQVPLGFNPRGVLTMTIALPAARYDSPDKIVRFYDQLLEKVKTLPGVAAATISNNAPFDADEWDSSFHITGTPPDPPGQEPVSEMSITSPDYFRVLEMSILRGRTFGAQDVAGRPGSVIIDEKAAQRFFPGENPIGRQIDDPVTIGNDQNAVPLTIVGIVSHTRNSAPGDQVDARNLPMMYFPAAQFAKNQEVLMVRAAPGRDPHSLLNSIKQEVASLDPEQAVSDVATMEENIGDSLASRRLTMALLGVFAGLALSLASIGLYGVMALTVTQRTRELGIRLALGAHRADVFRLVLGQGMLLVGIGLACGLIVAASTGRGLTSVLYNVTVWDPPAFLGAIGTLAVVALVACWLPALRATRVDPIVALRTE